MSHTSAPTLPPRDDDDADLLGRIDLGKLALAVQVVVNHRRITNAQAAREAHLTPSRISETLRQQPPSKGTLFALLVWLHMDAAMIAKDRPA